MKILIYYFTGSGNTGKIINEFKTHFEKDGHSVDLIRMENQLYKPDKKIDVDNSTYDLIGIGYPVHAFNAPQIVLDWARSIDKLNETKRAFIINDSAEPMKLNNISSIKLSKILKKKGLDIQNEYHYLMPYDMIYRHKQKMAYNMWETSKMRIAVEYKDILDGIPSQLEHVPCGALFAWIMRIQHFGAKFNGIFYRVDKKKCIKCDKCLSSCPMNNIERVNDKLKFGTHCAMCQRCTTYCPTDAIKAGLFNSWKVNKPYSFKDTDDVNAYDKEMTKKERKRADFYNSFWCKGPYKQYFKELEERFSDLNQSNAD